MCIFFHIKGDACPALFAVATLALCTVGWWGAAYGLEFTSAALDVEERTLVVVFDGDVDPGSVDASKFGIWEGSPGAGGIWLAGSAASVNGTTLSLALTDAHMAALPGIDSARLVIETAAVAGTAGDLLDTSFDVSAALFTGAVSVQTADAGSDGFGFSADGTRMFVGEFAGSIRAYALEPAFNVSSARFLHSSAGLGESSGHFAFGHNGSTLFVPLESGVINQYGLRAPFDVSHLTLQDSLDVRDQDPFPYDVAFSADGRQMFIVGADSNSVIRYALSAPFDMAAANRTDAFAFGQQADTAISVEFDRGGSKMLVLDDKGAISRYSLPEAFALNGAGHDGMSFDLDDVDGFSASAFDIAFDSSGSRMFVLVDPDGFAVAEYVLGAFDVEIYGNVAPAVVSIELADRAEETTANSTLAFIVTFSEPVQNVDVGDFELAGTGSGSIVTVTVVDPSRYRVLASATADGTYGLDLVGDHGIADLAGNPLASTVPTGEDQSYTVSAEVPTVESIRRDSPETRITDSKELTFQVTFSEPVSGVDRDDFVLALDDPREHRKLTHTSTPSLPIPFGTPISDTIAVTHPGSVASVSVDLDIRHAFAGDLVVDLISPDGTTKVLHNRAGAAARDIRGTYTPDFEGVGVAGDWVLRIRDYDLQDAGMLEGWSLTISYNGTSGTVTGLTGHGRDYRVAVSTVRDATYSLDLVGDHGISDLAGNPLASTVPTGEDQSYLVFTGPPVVESVARSDGAAQTTAERLLAFEVTFSEPVAGVDRADFLPVSHDATMPGRFSRTSAPSLAIPDASSSTHSPIAPLHNKGVYNSLQFDAGRPVLDAITVPDYGLTTAVSVHLNITHHYASDLEVDLISPDGKVVPLHVPASGNADSIVGRYAPEFGGVRTAGDWTLRVRDFVQGDTGVLNEWTLEVEYNDTSGAVTGLTGHGRDYRVTVSTVRNGTYGLDLVGDHGISDLAGNPLASTVPTGEDQSYTVDTTAPGVVSVMRGSPAGPVTDNQTLVFEVTFSEPVADVDQADFRLSSNSTGLGGIIDMTGYDDRYNVTASVGWSGTYGLDLVGDHGIADLAGNPLASTVPTGEDQSYAVRVEVPVLKSIARGFPEARITNSSELVFNVTFSEPVAGVDQRDFLLSRDGTRLSGLFANTSRPHLAIPDVGAPVTDVITVRDSGTVTAVSVHVDIAHVAGGNLLVELISPDGTRVALHEDHYANERNIDRTYRPVFEGAGTAGDWTLRVRDSVQGAAGVLNGWTLKVEYNDAPGAVTGHGGDYRVAVSAVRDGTYGLDLVGDHGIADLAGNPLASTVPTGEDQSYTVDTTAPSLASIERRAPAGQATAARQLVFGVAFSEPVTGVDLADFVLSPDGAGMGNATVLSGSGGRYNVTAVATADGTYNLDLVGDHGIADLAGNPLADTDPSPDQSFTVAPVTPVLTEIQNRTVNELSPLTFAVAVANGDILADRPTYGLDGAPAGASVNPATGVFEWVPGENQDGRHTITVTASARDGHTGSQDVDIVVNEVNANPVLDEIPDQTVDELSVLTFVANATDSDRHPGAGVEIVADNLRIPWSIDWIPDGTALFTERGGSLRMIRDGVLVSDPLLSLNVGIGEGGLLGIAVDPDFGDNRYIYLYYSTRSADNTITNKVVRYQFANGTVTEDRVLIDKIPGAPYHDGGRIQFGPDGKLYVTTGDAVDPALAQDANSLAGKILRMNRDGTAPADNPFANSVIWSLGHRNPQGIDWDASGNLVATEHGPSGPVRRAHDEINLIVPGANYGWPDIVGGESAEGLRTPILHTGNDTWAPSGAEFYDGDRIPGWAGKYFVAALRGEHLHVVDLDLQNGVVVSHEGLFQDQFGRLRDVQTGPDGFLYVLTSNRDGRGSPVSNDDRILRIVPVHDNDRSRPANTLTYGLDGAPEGASIDPVSGTFVWEPDGDRKPGLITFNVTVSDGRGGTDAWTVTVHVSGILPGAPQNLRTNSTHNSVTLAWDRPDDESITGYRVFMGKVADQPLPSVLVNNTNSAAAFYAVEDLEPSTAYAFAVAAINEHGESDSSGTVYVSTAAAPASHFVTTWQTNAAGDSITIPVGGSTATYIIDWGDGAIETDVAGDRTHAYDAAGNHTVRISGDFERIYLNNHQDAPKLVSVDQWGGISWTSMEGAFAGATNVVGRAVDTPDLSGVTDMSYMFSEASSFNGNMSSWDVSQVTDMSHMFAHAGAFNQPISNWNVSSVANTAYMFEGAVSFNRPLSPWDVSQVTDMSHMFLDAEGFAQNLGDWYIVLDDTVISSANETLAISAQNAYLDSQSPTYAVDDARFVVANGALAVKPGQNVPPGTYSVAITSAGGFGTGNSRVVEIAVDIAQTNDLPSVEAGPSQTVKEGAAVTLAGNATGADQLTYLWTHDQPGLDIILANAAAPSTTFTAPQVDAGTTVTFTLTVSGSASTPVTDQVEITISNNSPPVVSAGSDQTVTEGSTVNLNGTASDTDREDTLTYEWTHNSTLGISIANSTAIDTTFTAPQVSSNTTITLTLSADDGTDTSSDTMSLAIIDTSSVFNALQPSSAFVTTWRTTTDNESITIPTYMTVGVHTIDWGDGTAPTTARLSQTHVYEEPGTYTVSITGDFTQIKLYDDWHNAAKLVSIDGWGDMQWGTMDHAFGAASSMMYNATDAPDFSALTSLQYMFYYATSFNGDISDWNVSSVTSMSNTLAHATSFNGDISDWDVSNVEDMYSMFFQAEAFNGDISDWDVSSVTDMNRMFIDATSFNGDISNWNVSAVTDMTDMFVNAHAFDQNLGNWYIVLDNTAIDYDGAPGLVGSISAQNSFLDGQNPVYRIGSGGDSDSFELNGSDLILKAVPTKGSYTVTITSTGDFGSGNSRTFDIEISGFNDPPTVNAGSDQTVQEGDAVTLNGTATDPDDNPLTYSWSQISGSPTVDLLDADTLSPRFTAPSVSADTELVLELTAGDGSANATAATTVTVRGVPASSHFVTTWKTTHGGESITIPTSGTFTVDWGDGAVGTDVSGRQTHTYDAPGTYTVRITDGITGIKIDSHPDAEKLVSIVQWGDARWKSMDSAFAGAANMAYLANDIPDLSHVASMHKMFHNADSFNGNLSAWDVSRITDMKYMFYGADSFNGDLSAWNVSSVTDMFGMFWGADSFNGDLSAWDVSGVVNMARMFSDADSFNQPLSAWDVSSVTGMSGMFAGSASFNQPLSAWDVSSVTGMSGMFAGAASFNQPLSAWDVSRVTDTYLMFMDADSFNQPLSAWDVSRVTTMSNMFRDADSFNQPLSAWNVSSVTGMFGMFMDADSFNQPLSAWDVSRVTTMSNMFRDADSFNQPLSAWDVSRVTDMSAMFYSAKAFDQNLGRWYIILNDTATGDAAGVAGRITAQNSYLDRQNPTYRIGSGGDSDLFEMDGSTLRLKAAPDRPAGSSYTVTVTSTGDFGVDNSRILEVRVSGTANAPPSVDAGSNQTVTEGDTVTLSGTATDRDNDSLTYLWSHNSALEIAFDNSTALSTTFTASQVDSDTTITFTLTVSDGSATSSDSLALTITDVAQANNADVADRAAVTIANAAPANAPPSVDAGSNQTVTEGDTVTLSGTATDRDNDSLTYLWSHNSALEIAFDNSTALSTTFTASQVDSDTTITFTLTVSDGSSTTSDSLDVIIATNNDVAPAEPPVTPPDPRGISGLTLISTQSGTIQATWNAPNETPRDYRISWAKVGEQFLTWTNLTGNAFPTASSHTIPGLEGGAEYEVKVRARYGDSAGAWSDIASIAVAESPAVNMSAATVPGAPQNLHVSLDGSGTLNVSWHAPTSDGGSNLTGYRVQWKDAASSWSSSSSVSEATTSGTTYAITGLTNEIPYAIRVIATNQMGSGAPSEEETGVPNSPRKIVSITLNSISPGVVEASWEEPREQPVDYRISWAKVGEQFLTWTNLTGNAFPTASSHTIPGLEGGAEYEVKVRARYGDSAGAWSDVSTVTVAGTE